MSKIFFKIPIKLFIRKAIARLACVLAIVIVAVLTLSPFVNNAIAKNTAAKLADLPLPENTEYIESAYRAGKLDGNGNGMQYFGAILIKSQLPLAALNEHYSRFADNSWECIVEPQTASAIKAVEHESLSFKAKIEQSGYYIVYSWGENHTVFHGLDIRGH